jgi:hypothetical protein
MEVLKFGVYMFLLGMALGGLLGVAFVTTFGG